MRYRYSKRSKKFIRIKTKQETKEVIKMYQADIDELIKKLLKE
jgi:uncharacterized membrane protein